MTLQELYDTHPEWRDLELGLNPGDGELQYVGQDAGVYRFDETEDGTPVLVFSAN